MDISEREVHPIFYVTGNCVFYYSKPEFTDYAILFTRRVSLDTFLAAVFLW